MIDRFMGYLDMANSIGQQAVDLKSLVVGLLLAATGVGGGMTFFSPNSQVQESTAKELTAFKEATNRSIADHDAEIRLMKQQIVNDKTFQEAIQRQNDEDHAALLKGNEEIQQSQEEVRKAIQEITSELRALRQQRQ